MPSYLHQAKPDQRLRHDLRRGSSRLAWLSALLLVTLTAPLVQAEPCLGDPSQLQPGTRMAVSYEARPHQPGYRFSLAGADWELQEARVSDQTGNQTFSVIYPFLRTRSRDFAPKDFFLSIDANESDAVDCSDMPGRASDFDSWFVDSTLYVTDDYRSRLRPGAFSTSLNRLQTQRTLATTLRVREAGVEVVVATGFASTQMMDLDVCLKDPGDTIGIVENRPGEIHITCYPENEAANYVSNIDWIVDYHWPANAPALIDELIDYVHVERLP